MKLKITVIGAGSEEFGPASVHDIFLSDLLCQQDLEVVLMDVNEDSLPDIQAYAEKVAKELNRNPIITSTSNLDESLKETSFVIIAIELKRYHYWAQDFHIPRKYGFKQVYGENGGVGGLFHALRNIKSTLEIAKRMEKICPEAWLLNYTNPLTKVCEAINILTSIKTIGLCHGILAGKYQLAQFLEMDEENLEVTASGLNHISWFQSIKDKNTGEDLYPKLKSREKQAHWLAEWDEIALSRILMRTYGLYPSPGANHIVEYIRWADDFLASDKIQFFYDPNEGHPWETGEIPTWVYSLQGNPTQVPLYPEKDINLVFELGKGDNREIIFSREYAIPIIEGLVCGANNSIDAVNVPNNNFMPGIPEGAIVEVPAIVNKDGLQPQKTEELPEAILALLRTQVSINRLLIEAFDEQSKNKLLQAILLEPTVNSYNNAVSCMNEMLAIQKDVLSEFK
jgi:alpha-galactosidase